MAENPYIQQTNADAAQFFAQQNLANQQNRGGGGGGSGNSLQEIMTGGQFQHGLDQKAADADLARKQEMAKLAFSQDMELRKVDAANAGINQERANQYAQGQEATQNANAMARQAQQQTFQQQEQATQNTFVSAEAQKRVEQDRKTAEHSANLMARKQQEVQLLDLELEQAGEASQAGIAAKLDVAKAELRKLENSVLAGNAAYAEADVERKQKYTNHRNDMTKLEESKKTALQPITDVASQKSDLTIGGVVITGVSHGTKKGVSLRNSTEGKDTSGPGRALVAGAAKGFEGVMEFFGAGDSTTADIDVRETLAAMANPEYAKQILASAYNFQGGALQSQIKIPRVSSDRLPIVDSTNPTGIVGNTIISGKETEGDRTEVRAFRSQLGSDALMGVLESSNIPIADKAQTESLFQELMTTLQEQSGTKYTSAEQTKAAFERLNPILTKLSSAIYGNEFNQPEVFDIFTTVAQGWAADALKFEDAVANKLSQNVSVDGNTVILAAHADAYKALGKLSGIAKSLTKNQLLTADTLTTLNAAMKEASGEPNLILQNNELSKLLDAADVAQSQRGKKNTTRSAMEELVSEAKKQKEFTTRSTKQKLDLTQQEEDIKKEMPTALSNTRANKIARLRELLKLNEPKP